MAWDRWHSSLLSIRAGAIKNTSALPLLEGQSSLCPVHGELSVQLPLSQQVLEARVMQRQCPGTLWPSLSLIHYRFLTVSSCPFFGVQAGLLKADAVFLFFLVMDIRQCRRRMWCCRRCRKLNCTWGVILPFLLKKPFYTSPFLIAPLGFPIAKKTHPCVWKSIYSLFTLQLWENSIPWFVFVLAFLVCGYCCRKVLIASFHINISNFRTLM